jgi:hypothetical protein
MLAMRLHALASLLCLLLGCSSGDRDASSSAETKQISTSVNASDARDKRLPPPSIEPTEKFPTPLATLRTKPDSAHTVFEGTLGGTKVGIVFDTGMVEGILVSESVAKDAGLKRLRDFEFGGLGHGSKTKGYIAGPTTLILDDITLRSEVIVVPENSTLGRSLCGVQAVMGYTLLQRYTVRVQPHLQRIELFEKGANYSQPGEELDLLFDEKDRKISLPIALTLSAGRTETRTMIIDTGNSRRSVLFEDAPSGMKTVIEGSFGASGLHTTQLGRIETLSVGGEVFYSPIVGFDGSGNDGSGQHNLSNEFMTQFEAVYDLARKKLVLRKTAKRPPPSTEFGNGLVWTSAGCGHVKEVHMVLPDSVAAATGLRSGDTLVAIDGEPALGDSFRSKLEKEQPVSAQFRRGKRLITVKLHGEDRMPKPLLVHPDSDR